MIDQALERRLNDCRSLLKLWGLFQQYFEAAIKGDGINPENEKKFLDLKSRIAMLHDNFLDAVEEGGQAAVAQGMLDNVIRSITLKHINRLPPADIRKMQIEWHEVYLLLNESIGQLEEKELEVSKITPGQFRSMQAQKAMSRYWSNLYNSNLLRGVIVLGVVGFIFVGLPMMGVFSYGALRDVGLIQKPVFWVENSVVRPYIYKVNWRTVDEAQTFGTSGSKPPDFVSASKPFPDVPQDPKNLEKYFSSVSGDTSVLKTLDGAKESNMEHYTFGGGSKFSVYYYLLSDTKEASDCVQKFRSMLAALPPAQQEAAKNFILDNSYNLVILVDCANDGAAHGYLDNYWQKAVSK